MTTNSKNLQVIETAAEGGYRQANFEEILEAARAALALVDIRALDHLIVAGGQTISMAERGLI